MHAEPVERHGMRRLSLLTGAAMLAVTLAIPSGTAFAAPERRPHGSTKAFCHAMSDFLKFMGAAKGPSALKGRHGKRVLHQISSTAPKAVAKSTKTLVSSLEHVRDHGKNSLSKRANAAAKASLTDTARFVVDHCANSRATREYAQMLAGPTVTAAQSSLRNGLTNAKGLYTDTDSYASATAAALQAAEPSLVFTDGPSDPSSTKSVSVHVISAVQIVMAADTGTTCYFIRDSADGPGVEFASAPGSACDAANPPATWTTSW